MPHWIEVAIFDVVLPLLALICFTGIGVLLWQMITGKANDNG